MTNLDSILKSRHYFSSKGLSSQGYGFSSSHVWMWELDCEKSWESAEKSWCFWTVVLEKTLKSLLDCKEIQPVHPKGNQPWIVTERTDTEAKALLLWPPEVKSWLIGKDPDAGKHRRQEEKEMTEDEMVGWHPWLNGREFEQALGDGEGQGRLACCSPWSRKELDNWATKQQLIIILIYSTVAGDFILDNQRIPSLWPWQCASDICKIQTGLTESLPELC